MRALYVENNEQDVDLTRRALARATPPIAVDIAITVAEAIDKLANAAADYNWVLFDLNLPDADGLQVLRYVREQRLSIAAIAAIAVTGTGDEHAVIHALKMGVDDYIIKQGDYLDGLAGTLQAIQKRSAFSSHNKLLNVLYAEDDIHDALLATRYLSNKAPYLNLDIVNSDREVLQRLKSAAPSYDVLLLDYRLANSDALELAAYIRNQLCMDIPIVIVTGKGSEAAAARALRVGVTDYLIKDDSYLQRLPAVIEFAYARSQLTREDARLKFLTMYEEFLRESKDAAEANSLAKSGILANMSHEIRTPLNAISGLNFLLQKTELTELQREYATKTAEAVQYLLNILNDVLDFSKIEAGKLQLEETHFDLGNLLAQVHTIISASAESKGLALSIIVAADVPAQLCGDPLRLQQVLINLASNAIKFTERGSITINVSLNAAQGERIDLGFSIKDTGIGLSAEQIATIFDAFEQGSTSTSRHYGGSGLGLAICKQLVGLMGGAIVVMSTPGVGSNFQFNVLLKRSESGGDALAHTAAAAAAAVPVKLQGCILLVEDNAINQQVGQAILNHLGLHVDIVDNGKVALETLALHDPNYYDLIFMDLQMPEMDGIEATEAIRKMAGFAELPIIAMTADALAKDRLRCLAAGMNDHVTKPISIVQLQQVLENWLPQNFIKEE